MTYLPPVVQALLIAVALIAAVYDVRVRRIPNWLVLAGLLLGIALNAFLYELPGLQRSALGLGLAFLIYFPLYLLRGMGAGDVKLMGAVGAIVGPWNWLGIFLLTAILGGIFAVALLFFKGRVRQTFWNVGYILTEMAHFRAPYTTREGLDVQSPRAVTLPHGAMIALGSLSFIGASDLWAPR